jgi:hypothetical protein
LKEWWYVLKPFDQYLKSANFDILNEIPSIDNSSKAFRSGTYTIVMKSEIDWFGCMFTYKPICSEKGKILTNDSYFLAHTPTMDVVDYHVQSITFLFKTKDSMTYTIYRYKNIFYHQAMFNFSEFKRFATSTEAFNFIEEKLLLDLFS